MADKLAILGGTPTIPPGTIHPWPPVEDVDRQMVLASLEGGQHTYGPNCKALEKELAAWNGNRFAIVTNSGTAALHMCVAACGCGVGDEVIVPAYSWSSSATCVLHHNAIPVFVDIDWDTMNVDLGRLQAAITPRTKAIMAVHLHGLALDMDKLLAIAGRHGLKVIEDACQSHGATFRGRKVGTMGNCAAFSFNQNKCLCGGEGGAFVTDDEGLLAAARQLWSFGETRAPGEDRDYHAYALGWMYRGNDLTAAFARAQLTRLDRYLERQKANAADLTQRLSAVPGLILPKAPPGHGHTYYNYTVRFDMESLGHARDAAAFRDKLGKALRAEGVPTSVWQGWPLPEMTVFQAKNGYGHGCPWFCPHAGPVSYDAAQYPVARRHSDWHTGMTTPLRLPNGPEAVEMVAKAFDKLMRNIGQAEKIETQ
jgi:dTDP-4-amino-4,6-dideoxygalactose transaminase